MNGFAMATYTINTDNNITAFAELEDALNYRVENTEGTFSSEKELAKLSTEWPISRFVEVWNSFAGIAGFGGDLKPLKKFTDRKTAVARIWRAIQNLDVPVAPQPADVAPAAKRSRKAATPKDGAPAAREGSKKQIVLLLLARKDGATLSDISDATGWKAHSIRGFISGGLTKKMGLKIVSAKNDAGARAYRIAE